MKKAIDFEALRNGSVVLISVAAVLLRGLYGSFFAALTAALLLCLSGKRALSAGALFCGFLMLSGLIVSDAAFGCGYNFIYELPKLLLLFSAASVISGAVRKRLLLGFYIGCTCSSAVGIIAYVLGLNGFELLRTLGGGTIVQGVLGYANTTGMLCCVGTLFSLYYAGKNKNYSLLNEALCIINAVCLLLTGSALSLASLAAAVVFALCVRFRRLIKYAAAALGLCLVLAALLFAVGRETVFLKSTLAWRLIYYCDAVRVIIRHPLGIGVYGWQNLQYGIQSAAYSVKYVHNGFLQLALDGGIFALAGAVLLTLFGIRRLITRFKKSGDAYYLYLLAVL